MRPPGRKTPARDSNGSIAALSVGGTARHAISTASAYALSTERFLASAVVLGAGVGNGVVIDRVSEPPNVEGRQPDDGGRRAAVDLNRKVPMMLLLRAHGPSFVGVPCIGGAVPDAGGANAELLDLALLDVVDRDPRRAVRGGGFTFGCSLSPVVGRGEATSERVSALVTFRQRDRRDCAGERAAVGRERIEGRVREFAPALPAITSRGPRAAGSRAFGRCGALSTRGARSS